MELFLGGTLCPKPGFIASLVAAQVPRGLIPLFIQLPGATNFEGIDFTGKRVFQLKDAIISKFKLFKDFDPSELQLFKLDGSAARTLLDPTHTLSEAGITARNTLVVELTEAPPVASISGACLLGLQN